MATLGCVQEGLAGEIMAWVRLEVGDFNPEQLQRHAAQGKSLSNQLHNAVEGIVNNQVALLETNEAYAIGVTNLQQQIYE